MEVITPGSCAAPVGLKHPHNPQMPCFWADISINASPSLLQIPVQAHLGLGSPLVTPDGLDSVPHQALATHPWREHNGMQPAGRRGQVQIILLIMQNGEQASQNKEVQWRENILPSFSVSLCLPHSNYEEKNNFAIFSLHSIFLERCSVLIE